MRSWLSFLMAGGVFHDNPDDRLPPVGEPPNPNPAPVRSGDMARPVCEFCECNLTHTGQVLKFSDKAKRYRRHDDTIEELNGKIATLETQLREARAKLAELEPRASADSGGLHL